MHLQVQVWRAVLGSFACCQPLGNTPEKTKVFILADDSSAELRAEHPHPWGREPRGAGFPSSLSGAL